MTRTGVLPRSSAKTAEAWAVSREAGAVGGAAEGGDDHLGR